MHYPKVEAQLDWIAHLPASREAERLLSLPEIRAIGRDPTLPALLTLLQWAIEQLPGRSGHRALATWEDLMQLDLMGRPKAAVLALLRAVDPEREVPSQLRNAATPAQAAAGMLALAS